MAERKRSERSSKFSSTLETTRLEKGKTKAWWQAFTNIVCGTRAILKTGQEVVFASREIMAKTKEKISIDGTLKWYAKERPVIVVRQISKQRT